MKPDKFGVVDWVLTEAAMTQAACSVSSTHAIHNISKVDSSVILSEEKEKNIIQASWYAQHSHLSIITDLRSGMPWGVCWWGAAQ